MAQRPNHPKHSHHAPQASAGDERGERLQKVLAAAGIASRRECEQIILEGRVEVDGQVVTQLGTRVHPQAQQIRVDGVALPRPRLEYYIINKPSGVVTTSRDPWARTRAIDLAPERAGRVFAVGRLDMSSEGLVLLTSDGELANRLAHPRYGIEKTYLVQVAGDVGHEVLDKLRHGVWLAEGHVRPERAFISRRYKNSTILEVVLREGKNREIRRILAALGHKVQRLRRVAIGPLRLGDLPLGQSRALAHEEVRRLKQAAERSLGESRSEPEIDGTPEATPAKRAPRKGASRYPWKRPGSGVGQRSVGKPKRADGKPQAAGSGQGARPGGGRGPRKPSAQQGRRNRGRRNRPR
jgi:23S rRNA pseudouridine2605 synthase